MFKSKCVLAMIITAVLLGGGVGTYCVIKNNDAKSSFAESGYIIDGTEDLEGGFAKYTFDAGTELEYSYPDNLKFKSTTNEDVVTDRNCFLHFNDGSLSALSQGVLIDLNECEVGVLNYYNLTSGATLENQGGSYALETKDASLYFKDFLWKIGDDKYMLASDEIVITMADKQELEFSEYVELKYYNEGILLILSENGAYRTVSSECVATVDNGIRIDLASRTVMAKDTVLMSMEQMVIGSDDNIDILAPIKAVKGEEKVKQEQMQIHIPTFEVIDGADGVNGEQGIDGTKGKTGAEGAAGVNGMDGLAGAEGLMGEDGINGNQGDPGMPGTPGTAGSAGANGATGASGAQGLQGAAGLAGAQGIQGNDGLSGDEVIDGSAVPGGEEENIQLPTFTLTEMNVSSNEATFLISIEEGTVTLPGIEDITIKILDNASGREVRRFKLNSSDGSPLEVIVDGLAADTEYCLVVNASYIVKNGTYEKTFLKRVFTTNAIGLTFVKTFVTEDSLAFTVYKSSYSGVQSASLSLANESGVIKTVPIPAFDAEGKAVVLFENEYGEIESNTLYQVYLSDVFDGVKTFNKIGVQEHRTLKKLPELGVPRVVVDKANAVFNMQLEGLVDEENGIRFFRYELYPCYADGSVNTTNGPEKTMLISTNSVLACDVTQSMRNTTYRVRVVASFFDNEKTVEVASEDYSDPFAMMNVGFPLVTYTAKTVADPGIPGDTAITKHDRLVGTVRVETNDTRIRVDEQHPLTLYYKSGSGQIGQMAVTDISQYTFTGTDGNGTFDIPIDWSGLRASDNYVITVWAYTDLADNSGSASVPGSEFSNIQIGTIIARTLDPAAFQASLSSIPTASVGFSMRLTDANNTTSAAYEASTIDAIEVRIYSGDKTAENNTATLVASTILRAENDVNGLNSASQRNSTLGRTVYGNANEIQLTEADFPNFNPSQIDGDQYTVEIAAVQDYTEYRNRFTVSNNMAVFTKSAVPPAWQDEWASNGFEIIEIRNNRESLVSAGQSATLVNPNLPSNAVVGIKVTSKYDNSAGLATRFDYYAFEVGVNEGVTDASTFYTDIDSKKADMISIESSTGTKTVPSAVFLFKDISATGKLSRGHHYYFSGRVYIGDHSDYFPDSYVGDMQPVMKSVQIDVPYIAPSFKFLQYSNDGAGTLIYHYWIEAADPSAINSNFTVVGGNTENSTIVHSAKGLTKGIITINDIGNKSDVVVSCSVRSYYGDGGAIREVIKQAYEYEAGFDNFVYTLDNDTSTNRLKFTVKAVNDTVSKEPISRLTAIRVRLWKKNDTSTAKEFLLPLDVATTESATAYLNYSSISGFVGDQIVGEVVALYDSKVSGLKLAEGSGTDMFAIQVVPESTATDSRYIALDSGHTNITLGDSLAWNSLFKVTKVSAIEQAFVNSGYNSVIFDYTSLVDPKYNIGIEKNTLGFRPQMRGTVLTGPETVATLKQIKEKRLSCLVSEGVTENTFETNITNALPTIDLWLGNSYNIVTKPEGATVYWSIEGHDKLIENGQIRDNKMYLELYEVQNGSRVTLIGANGATSGNGVSYTFIDPADRQAANPSMSMNQNAYEFEITGLSPNKTYAIHFYYLDPNNTIDAATKHYPLDYKYSDTDRYYTFSTLDSVVLTPINNTAILRANSYTSKNLEISYVPSTTFGFQVKYDFVRRTGVDTYEMILSAEQLRQKGIVENTTLITEPTVVNLKFTPGLFQWIDGATGNTEYFRFGSDDYFLLMTPVSTVDESVSLGEPVAISLNIAEPNEPFYNVVATPGTGRVKFRIAITDAQRVIYNNTYKVVVKDGEGNVLTSADGVDGLRDSYSSTATYTITVSDLEPTDVVTLEIYAVTDIENIGTAPEIDTSDIDHRVKRITAQPLGDKTYDLGEMSILSAGGNKANLYFTNSVGIDEVGCPIANVIYSVTQLNDNSSRTYTDGFVVKTDSDDIKYIELLPSFESGVWYSVYIKFLGADGKSIEEATLSYRG